MARKYTLRRRAERQRETEQRITSAAVELHETVGPIRTTIAEIAQKAGVERVTVYRHFPDDRSLFLACNQHYLSLHPLPDVTPLAEIADPETRLRESLRLLYAYYDETEQMVGNVLRDAEVIPALQEVAVTPFASALTVLRDVLAQGWQARGRKRKLLVAALGHALDFRTWQSLTRQHALEKHEAIDLAVQTALCLSRTPAYDAKRREPMLPL